MNPESIFYSVVNGDLPPSQAGTLLGSASSTTTTHCAASMSSSTPGRC
ncbi:hypothetical protein [Stenotrophomonas maltophilia]|nr:hypothetical protein [Stenotrophomonas maltophilia]